MTAELTAPDLVTEALKKGDKTLGDVLALVLDVEREKSTATPPLPSDVSLNPEVIQRLKTLVNTLEGLVPPERRRELSAGEKEDFTVALEDVNEVKKAVTVAEDKIKLVFQNHADVVAITTGQVTPATPTNKEGFYVLEDKNSMAVKGLSKKVIRTTVEPDPVLTDEGLQTLERQGLISHQEYLAATRQTREVDETGVWKLIEDRPGLLPHLASVSKPAKAPYTQIRLVANKD
jgi:hypothetical protein